MIENLKKVKFWLIILPILSFGLIFSYYQYQYYIVNKASDLIHNGQYTEAIEYVKKLEEPNMLNKQKEPLLLLSCKAGNADLINILLDKGADPNYSFGNSFTALEAFCTFGYEAGKEPLLYLIDKGANPNIYSIEPPLFALAKKLPYMNEKQKAIFTEEAVLLIYYGANLQYDGTTMLHLCAKYRAPDLFSAIIQTRSGISLINMKDKDGFTPYDLAVKNVCPEIQREIKKLAEQYENRYNEIPEDTKEEILDENTEQNIDIETEEIEETPSPEKEDEWDPWKDYGEIEWHYG